MYNLPTVASYETLAKQEYKKQKKVVADKSCRHLHPLRTEVSQVFDDPEDEVYEVEHKVCPLCGHHLNYEELKKRESVLAKFDKLHAK